MADFDLEFKKIIAAEGGYANDKDDKGGETYMGISRRANPNWKGWDIIDTLKRVFPNPKYKDNIELTNLVKSYYKANYWDRINLDNINNLKLAHQLFDTAVNMGVNKAIKLLQRVLGLKETGVLTKDLIRKINEAK